MAISQDQTPTYLESITNEILAKYRRLDSILTHAPTKGAYHEKILRGVARNYLPPSFSVGEGFIVNKESEISPQVDLLVSDNLDPRSYVYKDHDFYILTNIAVTTFAEVKTYSTKSDFRRSFGNLIKTSQVIGENNAARVTSFIFCYDAHASVETFSEWPDEAIADLSDIGNLKSWNFPDYIFCLKKKIMLERKQEKGGFRYWHISSAKIGSNTIEQFIMQSVFQCITDGCARLRQLQGIKLLER